MAPGRHELRELDRAREDHQQRDVLQQAPGIAEPERKPAPFSVIIKKEGEENDGALSPPGGSIPPDEPEK